MGIEKKLTEIAHKWLECREPEEQNIVNFLIEQARKEERQEIGRTIMKLIDEAPVNQRLGQIENWAKFYLLKEVE